MAHAGLFFSACLLFGLFKLLQEYLCPIMWAVLCSIPLRGIQIALFRFWSDPLESGLTDTLIALPTAVIRASATTLFDIRAAFSHLRWKTETPPAPHKPIEFSRFTLTIWASKRRQTRCKKEKATEHRAM